jgi:hypothetical protein
MLKMEGLDFNKVRDLLTDIEVQLVEGVSFRYEEFDIFGRISVIEDLLHKINTLLTEYQRIQVTMGKRYEETKE